MKIYVNASAKEQGDGTKERPFLKIDDAAKAAKAGDEVLVAPGVYRESVHPVHSGTEDARITYTSTEPLGAWITGAQPASGWINVFGNVWMIKIANDTFEGVNPFTTLVYGDWYMTSMPAHIGDVYLDAKSLYEVTSLELVKEPVVSKASWDPEFSVYTWYTEQDAQADETVIYANFQGINPNEANVEISARTDCFCPREEGIGYITLSGFKVSQAATQWAPPTAYQEGMIAPHWSKGWFIEDCEVFESKCSGISLGKYYQKENDNKWSKWKYKDGTQTERECICQAQREGWSKSSIGSHIVRRCDIHDCGQTGIVGHLGGVFSVIEDNHIHHINNKQNLAGAEIGGIKMHAAIDVVFRRNRIHDCTRGIWLDWQAQGTRVTQNLFYNNTLPYIDGDTEPEREVFGGLGEDIFIEVSHGPTLLDNNIMLSARAVKLAAQGVALVHNLVAGSLAAVGIGTDNGGVTLQTPRYTPYHVPHQTEIAGFMTFLHGDVRFYNNIFVQQDVKPVLRKLESFMAGDGNKWDDGCMSAGTYRYDGYPTFEEWNREFEGYCGMGSPNSDRYYMHLPVWAKNNAYFNGARAWENETDAFVDEEHRVELAVEHSGGEWKLKTNLYEFLPQHTGDLVDTELLGAAFEPEQKFENADGTPIRFDEDYSGEKRTDKPTAGPLASGASVTAL